MSPPSTTAPQHRRYAVNKRHRQAPTVNKMGVPHWVRWPDPVHPRHTPDSGEPPVGQPVPAVNKRLPRPLRSRQPRYAAVNKRQAEAPTALGASSSVTVIKRLREPPVGRGSGAVRGTRPRRPSTNGSFGRFAPAISASHRQQTASGSAAGPLALLEDGCFLILFCSTVVDNALRARGHPETAENGKR